MGQDQSNVHVLGVLEREIRAGKAFIEKTMEVFPNLLKYIN